MINKTFIFSQLKEDAVLGMPFLKRHRCHINFNKSAVVMAGREPVLTDLAASWWGECRWYSSVLYLGAVGLQFAAE